MPREITDGWEERESSINQRSVMIDMRPGMDGGGRRKRREKRMGRTKRK